METEKPCQRYNSQSLSRFSGTIMSYEGDEGASSQIRQQKKVIEIREESGLGTTVIEKTSSGFSSDITEITHR